MFPANIKNADCVMRALLTVKLPPSCPVPPPVALQMQGLRSHSRTFSRRKLDFDESRLAQAPLQKKLRKTGHAVLKETLGAECGTHSHDLLSFESRQKQGIRPFKLAATYRRRGSKKVQDDKLDIKHGLASESVLEGISGILEGSPKQSYKTVDASHISEHGLPLVPVQKEVSSAGNGYSKGRSKDVYGTHHAQSDGELSMALYSANLRALNVDTAKQSSSDLDMDAGTKNSMYGDVGSCTQSSKAEDVTPLAQYSSRLDVVPSDVVSLADAIDTAIVYEGPFPSFLRPSQEECSEVCHRLWQLHGPLEEYAIHRVARISDTQVLSLEYLKEEDSVIANKDVLDIPKSTEAVLSGHPKERRSVLDSLVGTILSQNTTDTNSRRAFASLKKSFPTWEAVYRADPKAVEDAIRCGGLAEIKTSRILNILSILHQERGKLCLEYVRNLSVDEIKLELSRFKGVGPKTIACVLMFHLQQNEFPVDTHVFRITKMLGWVPAKADREKAYLHLNHRIPNNLKFDLHCLLVTHGKRCPRCAKGGRTQKPADGPCPLANLSSKFIEASPCDPLMEP